MLMCTYPTPAMIGNLSATASPRFSERNPLQSKDRRPWVLDQRGYRVKHRPESEFKARLLIRSSFRKTGRERLDQVTNAVAQTLGFQVVRDGVSNLVEFHETRPQPRLKIWLK